LGKWLTPRLCLNNADLAIPVDQDVIGCKRPAATAVALYLAESDGVLSLNLASFDNAPTSRL